MIRVASGLIRSARPKQWLKNLLVVVAPAAAGVLDEPRAIGQTVLAFVAFCLAASGTYLINDVRDATADRAHPAKRHRPVASGAVSAPVAITVGVLCLIAALGVAAATGAPWLPITIAVYLLLATAYSLLLKHIVIVDMVAVAGGFVLRAVAGAAAVGVEVSHWFLIVTSLGSLLIVAGKRASELRGTGRATRATLEHYTPEFLWYVRSMSSGALVVTYALWALDTYAGPTALVFGLSIVPFTIGVLRYAMVSDHGDGEVPEDLVRSDPMLIACSLLVAVALAVGVYVV